MANEALKQFLPYIHLEVFKIGEAIFVEGMPSNGVMYFIFQGTLTVSKKNPAGDDEVVRWLGPGEFFGELALIEPFPRAATLTVVSEEVKLGKIDKETFFAIGKKSPPFLSHILKSAIFRLVEVEARISEKKEQLANLKTEIVSVENASGSGSNMEEEEEAMEPLETEEPFEEPELSQEDKNTLQNKKEN